MSSFPGWQQQVLDRLRAPATPQNLRFLDAWQAAEGGTAAFNPLNTTQQAPGASSYNSVGVRNYPSPQAGLAATVQTLTNGYYGPIVQALRQGSTPVQQLAALVEKSPWGTHHFPTLGDVPAATSAAPPVAPPSRPAALPSPPSSAGIDPLTLSLLNQTNRTLGLAPLPPILAGPISQSIPGVAGPPRGNRTPSRAIPASVPARAPLKAANADYPLAAPGKMIGVPYQGSHTLFGNWESDNAVDIATPVGTPVYALWTGTIGSQIGPLSSGDPHLEGQRLHLVGRGDEAYYAHLSRIVVKPGQTVKAGQLLGFSGEANGVAHLHLGTKSRDPRSYVA